MRNRYSSKHKMIVRIHKQYLKYVIQTVTNIEIKTYKTKTDPTHEEEMKMTLENNEVIANY